MAQVQNVQAKRTVKFIKEKSAGNFPEKLAENFRKFSGKFPIFPRKFSDSHH
jgi:hypothetical protein